MTYDQWKTTDPRDFEPDAEQGFEASELEQAYDALIEAKEGAKHASQLSHRRIVELTASLEEALEYFKARYDIRDGDNGEQLPNEEMRLGQMIDETLYGIRF